MIDCEEKIFNEVARRTREKYPDIFITGEYVMAPPKFPCVSLVQIDNAAFRNSMTQEGKDYHAAVLFELNVYSNKTSGRKAECKEIVAFIDTIMLELNFQRRALQPIPNQYDATIYRMLGRYRAVVDNDTVYRR